MKLSNIAQEIRELVQTRQQELGLTFEEDKHIYTMNGRRDYPSVSKVMQLQPVEFDWKSNKKHDIGFVADSVKEVYPNLVSTNAQGEVEGMNLLFYH